MRLRDISHLFCLPALIVLALGLTACAAESPLPATSTPTATPAATATATSTPTTAVCSAQTGTVSVVSVASKLMKTATELRVYTPPCYQAGGELRYDVLYMLHGQTYDDTQWQDLGLTTAADHLISSGQIPPLIIVMPNEASSMSDADTSNFGQALIDEVLPWVDAHYDTCAQKACRAIGGLSRGGNWAVRIGLSHADQFAVVGAHSTPLFYGDLARLSQWQKALSVGDSLPMIYIDFGKSDEEKDQMILFNETLNDLGVRHQMVMFNGTHDPDYWSAHLEDYLRWYSAALSSPQANSK